MPTQPAVFGYRPPAAAPRQRAPTKPNKQQTSNININQDIKSVTQAIKASAITPSSNKSTYLLGGLALLAIASLAYQTYSQGEQIDLLQKDLSYCRNNQPTCSFTSKSTLSPDFKTTPFNMCWSLDRAECHQILQYDKGSLDIKGLFEQPHKEIVDHLSKTFEELTVSIGNKNFKHDGEMSRLDALSYHNCFNTIEAIKPFLSKFDVETLRKAAANARNPLVLNELLNALKENSFDPADYPMDQVFWATDPRSPGSNSDLLFKVTLKEKLPLNAIYNPDFFSANAGMQTYLANSEHFAAYKQASILRILFRADNQRTEDVKKEFVSFLEAYYPDNPLGMDAILQHPEISSKINSYGLLPSVKAIAQKSRSSSLPSMEKIT